MNWGLDKLTSDGVPCGPVGDAVRERVVFLGAGRGVVHAGVAEGVGPGQVHEHVVVWTDRLPGPSQLCGQLQVSLYSSNSLLLSPPIW